MAWCVLGRAASEDRAVMEKHCPIYDLCILIWLQLRHLHGALNVVNQRRIKILAGIAAV